MYLTGNSIKLIIRAKNGFREENVIRSLRVPKQAPTDKKLHKAKVPKRRLR
jgi:hypothetical protein